MGTAESCELHLGRLGRGRRSLEDRPKGGLGNSLQETRPWAEEDRVGLCLAFQGSRTAHPRSCFPSLLLRIPPWSSLLPLLQLELDVNPGDGTASAPPQAALPLPVARDHAHCVSFLMTRLSVGRVSRR